MIQKMLKDFVRKAIIRYAKEHNANVRNVLLNAYFGNNEICYALWVNNKPVKKLTFNEIMDIKFDFLNREAIFTPSFMNGLLLTAQEYTIDTDRINLFFGISPVGNNGSTTYNYGVAVNNGHNFVDYLSSQQFANNFGVELILKGG